LALSVKVVMTLEHSWKRQSSGTQTVLKPKNLLSL
jgi:hypothetical protein